MMSSLYIGATGLKSHGEGMSVITNNLANVNTVAYKQMSMQYSDLMSQYLTASSANMTNINQKGMGSVPGSNRTLFTQGGLETGSSPVDLCINGIGFFGVTKNGVMHYTRAGNFRFDKEGHLLDPSGWNVMGRAIVDGVAAGETTPIKLDLGPNGHAYMPPKATSVISSSSRLGGLEDKSQDPANPFFAMTASWDAAQKPPLGQGKYAYSEPITFYDSEGRLREATIYYDSAGKSGGLTAVEYLVALSPGQDGSGLAGTKAEGLLMAGTLTFSSNGELANMTAFYPPASGNPADLAGWAPAAMQGGQPVMQVQVKGVAAQSIVLDMGLSLPNAGPNAGAGLSSAAEAAANPRAIFDNTVPKTISPKASNTYGNTPGAFFSSRDGYAPGEMRDMYVTNDGLVRIMYNNNQTQDVYRVSLYRFTSQDGLRHEGSNHYSATPDSGPADEGIAGDQNFGAIKDYALEQSNVDYAREFTNLIVTQRGFQMNSKIITTSDAMLQKALELKR
ncbi:MAG: flagellar hook-basal body complex protein [Desulfovibrionaceae bacterium]|nr:flagellar hook-basal body complex protein [Desulfovibrionaceae bacterium]